MLKGLEAAEIQKSEINDEARYEAEFFRKRFIAEDKALASLAQRKIGSFASVTDGPHGYHVVDESSKIVMLTAKNAAHWFSDREGAEHIAESIDLQNRRSSLQISDVILSTRGTVGKCALVIEEALPANIDQDVARISWDNRDEFTPEFVVAYLNSRFGQDYIARHSSGMVQQGISLQKVREIPLPLLSVRVQQAIAATVTGALEQRRKGKDEYTQAETHLLDALGLRDWQPPQPLTYEQKASEVFSSSRWDSEFHQPGSTELTNLLQFAGAFKLSTIADVTNGFPWDSTHFLQDGELGEPFVRIRDCKPGVIEIEHLDRLQKEYATLQGQPKAQSGDLVLGMDGLKWFYAGLIQDPCYVNQRVAWIHPHSDSVIPSEYLMLIINSTIGQAQLLRQMTIAHTVGHITNVDARDLLIPELAKESRDLLTSQVRASYDARRKAKGLLEAAKRAVEIAIEEDEAAALAYLRETTT